MPARRSQAGETTRKNILIYSFLLFHFNFTRLVVVVFLVNSLYFFTRFSMYSVFSSFHFTYLIFFLCNVALSCNVFFFSPLLTAVYNDFLVFYFLLIPQFTDNFFDLGKIDVYSHNFSCCEFV